MHLLKKEKVLTCDQGKSQHPFPRETQPLDYLIPLVEQSRAEFPEELR